MAIIAPEPNPPTSLPPPLPTPTSIQELDTAISQVPSSSITSLMPPTPYYDEPDYVELHEYFTPPAQTQAIVVPTPSPTTLPLVPQTPYYLDPDYLENQPGFVPPPGSLPISQPVVYPPDFIGPQLPSSYIGPAAPAGVSAPIALPPTYLETYPLPSGVYGPPAPLSLLPQTQLITIDELAEDSSLVPQAIAQGIEPSALVTLGYQESDIRRVIGDVGSLTPEEREVLSRSGSASLISFGEQEQSFFEQENIRTQTGEWVNRQELSRLPTRVQDLIMSEGPRSLSEIRTLPADQRFNKLKELELIPDNAEFAGEQDGEIVYVVPESLGSQLDLQLDKEWYEVSPGRLFDFSSDIDRTEAIQELGSGILRYGAAAGRELFRPSTPNTPEITNIRETVNNLIIGSAPVIGTTYFWDEMSPIERVVSTGLDAVGLLVPFAGKAKGFIKGTHVKGRIERVTNEDTLGQIVEGVIGPDSQVSREVISRVAKIDRSLEPSLTDLTKAQSKYAQDLLEVDRQQKAYETYIDPKTGKSWVGRDEAESYVLGQRANSARQTLLQLKSNLERSEAGLLEQAGAYRDSLRKVFEAKDVGLDDPRVVQRLEELPEEVLRNSKELVGKIINPDQSIKLVQEELVRLKDQYTRLASTGDVNSPQLKAIQREITGLEGRLLASKNADIQATHDELINLNKNIRILQEARDAGVELTEGQIFTIHDLGQRYISVSSLPEALRAQEALNRKLYAGLNEMNAIWEAPSDLYSSSSLRDRILTPEGPGPFGGGGIGTMTKPDIKPDVRQIADRPLVDVIAQPIGLDQSLRMPTPFFESPGDFPVELPKVVPSTPSSIIVPDISIGEISTPLSGTIEGVSARSVQEPIISVAPDSELFSQPSVLEVEVPSVIERQQVQPETREEADPRQQQETETQRRTRTETSVLTEPKPLVQPEVQALPKVETRIEPITKTDVQTPRIPRTTPRLRSPDLTPEVSELTERRYEETIRGVGWKQGEVWITIFPPYSEEDILYTRAKVPDTIGTRGPREAWKAIKSLGYEPQADTWDEFASWFTSSEIETEL